MVEQEDLAALLGEQSTPIEFPAGLIGLEEWHRFVFISHPAGEPLRLMQSMEEEKASFIVARPEQIMADYKISLSAADAEALQYSGQLEFMLVQADDIEAYCILSVEEEPFRVTVNLLGPLVVNWKTGLGRQVILVDSGYSARHLMVDEASAEAEASPTGEETEPC